MSPYQQAFTTSQGAGPGEMPAVSPMQRGVRQAMSAADTRGNDERLAMFEAMRSRTSIPSYPMYAMPREYGHRPSTFALEEVQHGYQQPGMMSPYMPQMYQTMDQMRPYAESVLRRVSVQQQQAPYVQVPLSTAERLSPIPPAPAVQERPSPPLEFLLPDERKSPQGRSSSVTSLSEASEPQKRKRAAPISSFPIKLHKILSDPDCFQYIDWLPHGRAWRILRPNDFAERVLSQYFRSSKYSSFMRQVNGWGFRRITEGCDLNSYYHEQFLRGLPDICAKMRRPTKGALQGESYGEAPDFYKISMFAPLPDPDDDLTIDVLAQRSPKSPNRRMRSLSINSSHGSQGSSPIRHSADAYYSPERHALAIASPSQSPLDTPSLLSTLVTSYSQSSPAQPLHAMPMLGPRADQRHSPRSDEPLSLYATPFSRTSPSSFGDFCNPGSGQQSLSSWADQPDPFDPIDAFRQHGQVTPPGSAYPIAASDAPLRDNGGLSAADLCYLTQQNRFLLGQVKSHSPEEDNYL